MNNMGYTKFKDIDCVYYEEQRAIRLIAIDQSIHLTSYLNEHDFPFVYNRGIYKCTAYIKNVLLTHDAFSIQLIPYCIFEIMGDCAEICGFSIIGNAIDDFFNPANYFYAKHKDTADIGELIYNRENVDLWKIKFENTNISISLSYGEILSNGIGSDLMLHPKINVNFPKGTNDLKFIYRIYNVVIKFLQMVRYDLDIGWYSMELIERNGLTCGRFYEVCSPYTNKCATHSFKLNYMSYKPFIGRLLQFVSDNQNISLVHLPQSSFRISQEDYTPLTFITIFGAFEKECKAKEDLYLKINPYPVDTIRSELLKDVEKLKATTEAEKAFIKKAVYNINKIDKEVGQKIKIVNSYNVLSPALKPLIPNILYLLHINDSGFDIGALAEALSTLRGKIAHGETNYVFDDLDIQKIRFLEILTYAQMLKRALLDDSEIEDVLKIVFAL